MSKSDAYALVGLGWIMAAIVITPPVLWVAGAWAKLFVSGDVVGFFQFFCCICWLGMCGLLIGYAMSQSTKYEKEEEAAKKASKP